MQERTQKAIEAIIYRSDKFPEKSFQVISENKEFAIPYLVDAIKKAILEKDDLDEDYQLHFYALHLLGQFQEKQSFPLIMELVSLPSDTLDQLIGDAVTSSLPDILYNTYNGDLESLKKAIKDSDIDEYARGAMLKVMGQLYLDGAIEKKEWQDFIRQIVYGDQIGDYIYTELAYVICECHCVDMLQEIRQLYMDYRIEESVIGSYAECVDMMFEYREKLCKTPINAADMLRGWAMFADSTQKKMDDKHLEKMLEKIEKEQIVQNTKKKIGRNDPCPCGSGKKYKKCCMNKPQSPVEMIESPQEKAKWLKYYPPTANERESGRIYLEDFFDRESIEIDKLIYLALKHRPHLMWKMEPEEVVEKRKRVYLCEAFSKFVEKSEKEGITSFKEYDEKYAIHYQCEEWLGILQRILGKEKEKEAYKEVSKCIKKMM